ncbi:hypothetical protein ZIOFF_058488 [Zingiber officinale]|uniref:Uncharacterized protein n=1 Tax=Zingiber officinale TaxID=94328 RepID=A0A8J5FBN3_ZINOF|nr:hypothetical protein ZIOFF_058488 [Zingiber officinale]
MDSGDDQDVPDPRGRKKRYHRHTPRQIQALESMFKACPHPDEKQRMQLSRDLGLEPRQINWILMRVEAKRCHLFEEIGLLDRFLLLLIICMQAQQDRSDNCVLRSENDKIRCENIAMREALKNVICPSCGSSSCTDDSYFDESKLRMENTRLKEQFTLCYHLKLDRVSSIASRYLGRPMTQLPPVLPVSISSLDLSVGGYNNPGISTSLDLNLLLQNSSSSSSSSSLPYASISELDKPIMVEMASNAMEEVIRLVQTDEPLWMKSVSDGRDILQLETYDRMFKRSGHRLKFPDVRIEASRDSAVVAMNATTLIDMLMDSSKWCDLFPTIVSKARTIEVLGSGTVGSASGSLALMYEELQVLSPVVPTRELCFLRCCQPIQQGVWVVADISVDFPRAIQFAPASQSKKLPSGCLVEEMADGYAKVTWVEHVQIEENNLIPALFKDLMDSGLAFGAQRWLATLQRMCERFSCPAKELGVSVSHDGKRSMMKLAQRMVNNFCANIGASNDHKWITLSGLNDVGVRVTLHKSTDAGQPSGVLLSAATTIWLPISPESVFAFFKDERTRTQGTAFRFFAYAFRSLFHVLVRRFGRGLFSDRHSGHQRGHERRESILHPSPALRLHHTAGRAGTGSLVQLKPTGGLVGITGDHRVSNTHEQFAVGEAQLGVGDDG